MKSFKFIPGYEGLYAVSARGNVYSCITAQGRRLGILKPYIKNDYLAVNLYKENLCKHFYIHRLIAGVFISNPNNLKEVNHIDCDKHNNALKNLEWCSRKQNLNHAYAHGLKRTGELHGMHKLTNEDVIEIKELCQNSLFSQTEIAQMFSISQSNVSAIKCGRLWEGVGSIEVIRTSD